MILAGEMMELDRLCHQTEDQVLFKGILECLHLGWMTEKFKEDLRVLTLDDYRCTSKEIKYISDGTLHLFARHQEKNAQNEQKICETVT
jgi:hypothetical protein